MNRVRLRGSIVLLPLCLMPMLPDSRPALSLVSKGDNIEHNTLDLTQFVASDQIALQLALYGHRLKGALIACANTQLPAAWVQLVVDLRKAANKTHQAVRVPVGCGLDQLVGGLDVVSSLMQSTPIVQKGLLARADQSFIVLPLAEYQLPETVRSVCVALDYARVGESKDNVRAGVLALTRDANLQDIDRGLIDRLAFSITLEEDPLAPLYLHDDQQKLLGTALIPAVHGPIVELAASRLPSIVITERQVEKLCLIAQSLGVESMRAQVLCVRVARGSAAMAGRTAVSEADIDIAIRLCLAWRATVIPEVREQNEAQSGEQDAPKDSSTTDPENTAQSQMDDDLEQQGSQPPEQSEIESVLPPLPEGLLDTLKATQHVRQPGRKSRGRSGPRTHSNQRGRIIGTQRYDSARGLRVDISATLREAAPWQTHRKQQLVASGRPVSHIVVHPQDIRATRYKQTTRTVTVFVVDASGSAARQRLAEAKGAVELLLAQCYVRRDEVALIVFQGATASLVLSPTRSLVRARKQLSELPAGGGTPLASALDLSVTLCEDISRAGNTPLLCLLTDGRANVDRNGIGGRARAAEHSLQAARSIRHWQSIVIDISARTSTLSHELAKAMGGQYLALPKANARSISNAVSSITTLSSSGLVETG